MEMFFSTAARSFVPPGPLALFLSLSLSHAPDINQSLHRAPTFFISSPVLDCRGCRRARADLLVDRPVGGVAGAPVADTSLATHECR